MILLTISTPFEASKHSIVTNKKHTTIEILKSVEQQVSIQMFTEGKDYSQPAMRSTSFPQGE